jgi:recombinational DNA repair ATPase RecF
LAVLDEMISSLIGPEYAKSVTALDTAVKAKQRLIKYTLDSRSTGDLAMVQTLGQEIYKHSKYLWSIRQKFFSFWQENIETFTNWIDTPLKNWEIHWQISNILGQKDIFKNTDLDLGAKTKLGDHDWAKLWQKELASGKILFGAQRDDFSLISDHLPAESIFSRGEMRLLVLFVKDLAVTWSNSLLEEVSPVFYLYDDVFNELDTLREQTLFAKVLQKHDWFLASSTKSTKFDCGNFSISEILK